MAYWTLTNECLIKLKENWITYCNQRIDALNFLRSAAEQDYRSEGNEDLRYERYNARSVQEWYDDKVRKLDDWVEEMYQNIKAETQKFERLWTQACQDYYTASDYGYRIIYDFYRFERRREYDPEIGANHFRVKFSGQTHWYKHSGRRRDTEFITGKPFFDYHE